MNFEITSRQHGTSFPYEAIFIHVYPYWIGRLRHQQCSKRERKAEIQATVPPASGSFSAGGAHVDAAHAAR